MVVQIEKHGLALPLALLHGAVPVVSVEVRNHNAVPVFLTEFLEKSDSTVQTVVSELFKLVLRRRVADLLSNKLRRVARLDQGSTAFVMRDVSLCLLS